MGRKSNTEEYEEKLALKGLPYIVLEEYIGSSKHIKHLCDTCQNIWSSTPNNILNGFGCPNCSKIGRILYKPTNLYHVSLDYKGTRYYKLGITCQYITTRFGKDWKKYNMSVLWNVEFPTRQEAEDMERALLYHYRHSLVNTGLLKSGNSETLSHFIPKPTDGGSIGSQEGCEEAGARAAL